MTTQCEEVSMEVKGFDEGAKSSIDKYTTAYTETETVGFSVFSMISCLLAVFMVSIFSPPTSNC